MDPWFSTKMSNLYNGDKKPSLTNGANLIGYGQHIDSYLSHAQSSNNVDQRLWHISRYTKIDERDSGKQSSTQCPRRQLPG